MRQDIYLDNSATTKPRPEAVAAVLAAMEESYGNPSSPHGLGLAAERLIDDARESVAAGLGVEPARITFTSGGTEANNAAILGAARAFRRRGGHLITSRIEHPSVLQAFLVLEEEGFRVTHLDVDAFGCFDPASLTAAVTPETILISTLHVNNEIGSVQPLTGITAALGRLRKGGRRLPLWHVDAVQSFGKLPLSLESEGIDLLSVSAHKLHGPKGCGALYIREGLELPPLLVGGGQEGGRRSGTENVGGIVGFGVAAALALAEGRDAAVGMGRLRRRLIDGVLAAVPWARLNGPLEPPAAAPHIANISFPGLRGEVLVHALEEEGVYVSTGAACSARRHKPSHVLQALGLDPREVEGAIRFSLSPFTTDAEIETASLAVSRVARELKGFVRR